MPKTEEADLQLHYWTLVLAFIAIIFVIDLALPADVAVCFLYFIPLYASVFVLESKRAPIYLYFTCCLLIILGMLPSYWSAEPWQEILNTVLALISVTIGCLIALRDREVILERIRSEELLKKKGEEMAQMIAKLKRSNQDLDDFAYIASHDLKEPLRGLANNAKFLIEDFSEQLDTSGVARLTRMGYLCERMERLVNELLYFSRINRQDLAFQDTDLEPILKEIVSLLGDPSVELQIHKPLPRVYCDRPRITEVFRNLITNGVKYNNSKKKLIEVGFLPETSSPTGPKQSVFFVRDNGIGFEEQFYEDIFRIFKRLNEEDDYKKGTGAGLTFVRKIIERHKGRIWPLSTPGQGSTFFFTLGVNANNEKLES